MLESFKLEREWFLNFLELIAKLNLRVQDYVRHIHNHEIVVRHI